MPMQTRHWMSIVIGALTSVMTAAGYQDHSFPSVMQYLEVNAIPAITMIADWINARVKEWKGVTGFNSFVTAVKAAANAAPELKAALDKAGIKLPP